MKRIRLTRQQFLGTIAALIAILYLGLCFVLYQVEETRIKNLRANIQIARDETTDIRNSDRVAYEGLLAKYTTVYGQLLATGTKPSAPSPNNIGSLPPGPQGIPGKSATFSDIYAAVSDYCSTPAVPCKGDQGEPGTVGTPGDSVVGPPGKDGKDGTNGADGAPGAATNGVDGQPPVSWTYTDLLGSHTCSRTEPFDAAAPAYQCS